MNRIGRRKLRKRIIWKCVSNLSRYEKGHFIFLSHTLPCTQCIQPLGKYSRHTEVVILKPRVFISQKNKTWGRNSACIMIRFFLIPFYYESFQIPTKLERMVVYSGSIIVTQNQSYLSYTHFGLLKQILDIMSFSL